MSGNVIKKPYLQKEHDFFVNRLQGFSKAFPTPRSGLDPITDVTEHRVNYSNYMYINIKHYT